MLRMRNITKTFNSGTVDERVALDHMDLTLQDGDFVTVIGGNGAGKSTMQNAICGTWQMRAALSWTASTSPACRSISAPAIWAACIRTP